MSNATQHNKKFPIKKVSRTEMAKLIHTTKGRFFTSTHTGTDNEPHVLNCIRSSVQDDNLGYIKVHARGQGPRLINPQKLTDLSFNGIHYVIK